MALVRIADLEWLQVGRWWYVPVHTEEGIDGCPETIGGIMQAWKPSLHEDGSVADA